MKMGFAFCAVARLSDYMRSLIRCILNQLEIKWKMDLIFSSVW